MVPDLDELTRRGARGELTTEPAALAGSLLHMHANRILRSAARHHEAVLYRFLERGYDGILARSRKRNGSGRRGASRTQSSA